MVNFGYPYNDIVICKDSTDYLLFIIIIECQSEITQSHPDSTVGTQKYGTRRYTFHNVIPMRSRPTTPLILFKYVNT